MRGCIWWDEINPGLYVCHPFPKRKCCEQGTEETTDRRTDLRNCSSHEMSLIQGDLLFWLICFLNRSQTYFFRAVSTDMWSCLMPCNYNENRQIIIHVVVVFHITVIIPKFHSLKGKIQTFSRFSRLYVFNLRYLKVNKWSLMQEKDVMWYTLRTLLVQRARPSLNISIPNVITF